MAQPRMSNGTLRSSGRRWASGVFFPHSIKDLEASWSSATPTGPELSSRLHSLSVLVLQRLQHLESSKIRPYRALGTGRSKVFQRGRAEPARLSSTKAVCAACRFPPSSPGTPECSGHVFVRPRPCPLILWREQVVADDLLGLVPAGSAGIPSPSTPRPSGRGRRS